MKKSRTQKLEKTGKVSRKNVKEEISKSPAELIGRVDSIDAQRSFATRILNNSNYIISFLTPLFNDTGEIVDFTIEYINNRMRVETEESSKNIIGKKMSEYHPANFDNGIFDEFVLCMEQEEDREFHKKQIFGENEYWFSHKVTKLDDGVLVFSKNITKEKELEVEFEVQNKLLSEAEYVANIGSFKWNLDNDVIRYSDNAYYLLGCEPGDFEPSIENFNSFVHPDDSSEFMNKFKSCLERKERTEFIYRIITKDKSVKTVKSIGEFYRKDNEWYMVGVLADMSKQVLTELQLKKYNLQLERTNDELESFNRIASHDLQEPLRKIQMFISRLDEEITDKLGKKGKNYLTKISNSVERMRELISQLLAYSRVEEVEESLEKVNLSHLLDDVLEDLDERISENGATIITDTLPSVFGVKFQLEQLFSNLIGNALKYKKSDIAQVLEISSQLLDYNEIDTSLELPKSRYLKIQFKDNGIGFEPEHNEQIFEIFQRLHSKSEYSGSGLGLAICRKIVQSHLGAINAESILGEGATFTVYLPYSH